jgi:hypothetical protein
MKKILFLTLHKRWFDLVASGLKGVEYRVASEYWVKRIFKTENSCFAGPFDEVHFRNGYGKHRPLVVVEFHLGFITHASLCTPEHGEVLEGRVISLFLGKILHKENF